jgi:hypothetical protein
VDKLPPDRARKDKATMALRIHMGRVVDDCMTEPGGGTGGEFDTWEDCQVHSENYDGYCTHCREVTREGGTEPDATGYPCPDCGQNACVGMEFALISGLLDVEAY